MAYQYSDRVNHNLQLAIVCELYCSRGNRRVVLLVKKISDTGKSSDCDEPTTLKKATTDVLSLLKGILDIRSRFLY